jgi:hypothetical protein
VVTLSSKESRSLEIEEPERSAQRQRLGFQSQLIIHIVNFNLAINITSEQGSWLSLKNPPFVHVDLNRPGIDIHAIHSSWGKRSLSLNGLSSKLTLFRLTEPIKVAGSVVQDLLGNR